MNYYLNVSLIGSSTKNDLCQNVTVPMCELWHADRCNKQSLTFSLGPKK